MLRLRAALDARGRHPRAPAGAQFATFGAFYMVAFLLDATEEWEPPLPALAFLIAVPLIYLRGVTRWTFFAFLAASSAYVLLVHFPDPGNHNNIFLLCNLFLMAAVVRAARRPDRVPDDEALFEGIKPALRVTVSLIYILAGFHKLNTGFFHEQGGCAQYFFGNAWSLTPFPEVTLSGAALIGFGASVLLWELGGGLMLWFRRTQPVMLVMSLVAHAVLAELVFFDFSSLAFALLLTFIPPAYWGVLRKGSKVRIGRARLERLTLYVFVNVAVAALAGGYFQLLGVWPGVHRVHRLQGLALVAGLLIFLWPIFRHLLRSPTRIAWSGVPMWRPGLGPRWAVLLPAFVLFFGLNPYLGLRTTGTFTMFSNLQTEGDRSNHFLLGSNPLKVWGLQEDSVQVHVIDSRHADREQDDLEGNALPVVEFQKRIVEWREQGLDDLSARYEYEGRAHETEDLVADNPWRVGGYTPVHYLLDFRVVQQSGPTVCRW